MYNIRNIKSLKYINSFKATLIKTIVCYQKNNLVKIPPLLCDKGGILYRLTAFCLGKTQGCYTGD